jgi:hypothetical protein
MTGALYRLTPEEAALIQWWRGQRQPVNPSLAVRLRDIAADPTPLALRELPIIALSVALCERHLDLVVQAAREEDARTRTIAGLAKLTEPRA